MLLAKTLRITLTLLLSSFISVSWAQNWEQLYEEAKGNYDRDWEQAVELLEEALVDAESDLGQEDDNYASILNDLALGYWHLNDFEMASELFNRSLDIKFQLYDGQGQEYAAAVVNIAGLYQDLGDLNQSLNLYLEALEVYKAAGMEGGEEHAVALNNMGTLYETAGNYNRARELYLEALGIRQELFGEGDPKYASSLNNLGKLYTNTGELEQGKEYLQQAIQIYEAIQPDHASDYANTLDNLGRLFEIAGEFGKAERSLVAASEIRSSFSGPRRLEYARSLNNLGSLYRNLGNLRNAESYFVEARNIYAEELGNQNPQYATTINNLAQVYRLSGRSGEAESLYMEAAEIYKSYYGEEHPLYATALNNLARLYRAQGKNDDARVLYEQTIEIDKKSLGPKHPQYATSLTNLGVLYTAGGQTDKAEPLYREALDIRRESLGLKHPQYARSLNNLGLLYLAEERLAEAEPLFSEAIEVQITQIKALFPSLSEKEKEDYYKTVRLDQERFNSIVVLRAEENPKIVGQLFDNQLATKAILFSASDKMRRSIMSSGDNDLIQEFLEWRNLKADLARYYQVGKEELTKRKINLADLESHANDLEKDLSLRSEIFAHETDQRTYTWRDIQSQLGPTEAAIEIIRFREFGFRKTETQIDFGFTPRIHYAAIIVSKKTTVAPTLVLLENGEELETKYLANYKNSLKFRVEDWYSYDQYWAKINRELSGITKVYMSPDGVFNKLNPNVFLDMETKKYLIDEMDIEQVTNSKDILDKQTKENPIRSAVMIGNPDYDIAPDKRKDVMQGKPYSPPRLGGFIDYTKIKNGYQYFADLPGAQEEIVQINQITAAQQWENQTYMKATALEEVVKAVQNPKVLHIATHGFFSENMVNSNEEFGVSADNPLFQSGLMLAGSGHTVYQREVGGEPNLSLEDGILTAYEAMNLNLDDTDLVVLSACETGLGQVRNGEGVYGLERAFKVAGAKSIIISFVKVQDQATKELMTLFYQDWVKLGDKREAFQRAQREFRATYDDPYIWGAFVMIGD